MTTIFEQALHWVLDDEGRGYVEPPLIDQPTHSGLTLIFLKEYWKPEATVEELRGLTEVEITALYRKLWDRLHGDQLPGLIGYVLFDCAVNLGAVRPVRWLQQEVGATVDGVAGPQTVARVNRYMLTHAPVGTPLLTAELTAQRCAVYGVEGTGKYEVGLMRRAMRVFRRAIR